MDSSHSGSSRRDQLNGSFSGQRGIQNSRSEFIIPEPVRSSQPPMSRAEKFEEEKKRIMANCFQKTDEKGQLIQSYITHIRVDEDAAYQSSPPPPDASQEHKKPRLIIVGVKNTGRVFVHKAKENEDATFQIGKSWPMEDLKSIESFSNSLPKGPEEQQRAQWAGTVGFIITFAKPYYWQAKTTKEKEFFIGSLVKIYRKYTSGNIPQLIGFDQKEKDGILGASSAQVNGRPPALSSSTPQPSALQPALPRPNSPTGNSTPRTHGSGSSGIQRPQSPLNYQSHPTVNEKPFVEQRPASAEDRPLRSDQQAASVILHTRTRPSYDSSLRQVSSREQLRPFRLQPAPIAVPQRLTPQSSRPSFEHSGLDSSVEPITTRTSSVSTTRSTVRRMEQGNTGYIEEQSSDSLPLTASTTDRWRPNGTSSKPIQDRSETPAGLQSDVHLSNHMHGSGVPTINGTRQVVPERRRPPLQESALNGAQRSSNLNLERDDDSPKPLTVRPATQDVPRLTQEGVSWTTQEVIETTQDMPKAITPNLQPGPIIGNPIGTDDRLPLTIPGAYVSPTTTPPPPPPPSRDERRLQSTGVSLGPGSRADQFPKTMPSADVSPQNADTSSVSRTMTPDPNDEQRFRPGLGPMMGKKSATDIASKVRKAANAYGAFKPRAGGAGERLLGSKTRNPAGPDGVTGVVPAPSITRNTSQNGGQSLVRTPPVEHGSPEVALSPLRTEDPADVEVLTPMGELLRELGAPELVEDVVSNDPIEPVIPNVQVSNDEPKRSGQTFPPSPNLTPAIRESNKYTRCFTAMDIDPSVFEGRENQYEAVLSEFGWDENALQIMKVEALEKELRREIGRLEAGNWLGKSHEKDERVDAVEKMLDKAIAECDEMEGLLTIYGVELSTLNDDIAYIEAQSQGLQVQTANQKLLHTELQILVETISVSPAQLEPLRKAPFGDPVGLELIESTLLLLYQALNTIDPSSLRGKSQLQSSSGVTNALTTVRALREKKDLYLNDTFVFLQRLKNYMDPTFGAALLNTTNALLRNRTSPKSALTFDPAIHDAARNVLWQYSPLMLFAKDVDLNTWEEIIRIYRTRIRSTYQEELRTNVAEWKKTGRKATNDELSALFNTLEKENESSSGSVRKLTVKRSQTLGKSLRSASDKKRSILDKTGNPSSSPYETFADAIDEMIPLVCTEQNFIIDFFHASSQENLDFLDAVIPFSAEQRRGTDLVARRLLEPDRTMAKVVSDAMEDIFAAWPTELQSLVEWAVNAHPLQGVGILYVLERSRFNLEDSNQEFINRTLQKLQERLKGTFDRFVEDQVHAIEDTKVKIKKRRGVIAFMKIFPNFSAIIENMVPPADGPERLNIRLTIDAAYTRINKAMFDSLTIIAKESPSTVGTTSNYGHGSVMGHGPEPEDKEALNYHILLIENMYHYFTEVDERGDVVLGQWRGKAMLEMSEHQDSYVSAVVRRPLGKLLDFLESVENGMSSFPSRGAATNVPKTHVSHSKSTFKKIIGSYDGKEIRRGIDTLKKRIEKHFGEADDPVISQKLVATIQGECERRYNDVLDRTQGIATDLYEGVVEVEFGKTDISQAFRR